ncbi:uncharacterized protein LOC121408522 [Lytechinus variegatus]|uniref:uncharacterized protein LOC121408522 n=1 Tax=Lytechinus variegatus TaxID=7654 RepID=UPI001BB1200C|nr:uncharacterized protein LOC121408522 [Lytechinus variegatus]
MAENFLCLFRFFAFCRVLSLILPSINGYPLCTQAILGDFSADECPQIFPECTSGSLGSIEINSASVTVTSDDGYGGKDISTVDATEATNSIVNCGDVPTCEGVGYFLIAHFSTLHCLGIQPGMDSFVPAGLRYILAVVTVRYTGMQGVSTFQERYDGHFYHSVYRFGSGNNECSSFRAMSEHQLPFATDTSILSSIPCAYIYTTTNGVDTTDDLTESTSHSPVSTLAPSQSIHAIPTSDQGGITVSPWSDRDLITSVTSDTTTGDLEEQPLHPPSHHLFYIHHLLYQCLIALRSQRVLNSYSTPKSWSRESLELPRISATGNQSKLIIFTYTDPFFRICVRLDGGKPTRTVTNIFGLQIISATFSKAKMKLRRGLFLSY